MAAIWKYWNINNRFNLTSDMKRSSQIMPEKVFLVVMTSLMTSQSSLKIGPLYSFNKGNNKIFHYNY